MLRHAKTYFTYDDAVAEEDVVPQKPCYSWFIGVFLPRCIWKCYSEVFLLWQVAAQNCRKRKLDQIFSLEDELTHLKVQKAELSQEKENIMVEKETSYFNFLQLHDKILRSLMLSQHQQQVNIGQPFSNPENYTLQLTPDGNVYLAPRNSTNSTLEFPHTSNYRHPKSKWSGHFSSRNL